MEDWWEFKGTHKYLTASKKNFLKKNSLNDKDPGRRRGTNSKWLWIMRHLEHWQVTCKLKPRIQHGLHEQNQIPAGCCHPGTCRLQLLSGNSNGIHNGDLGCWHWGMEETGACRKLTTAFSHTISSAVAVKWWLWNFVIKLGGQ